MTEADVLITAALADRPARQPDFAAENQALHTLAQQLTDDPQSTLKTLVRIAQDLCRADTAGVSLLETSSDGTSVFRWVAIAGALESLEQTTTPGNFSPCATTIHCGVPQLYARPELYFTDLHHPQFPIVEGLLFPICAGDRQLGTIWIISHNEEHQFDREDQRLMTSLAGFTAAALQSIHLRQTAELALQREQAARLETEATRQALDKEAQRAVDILESITDAFVSLDREWRITYVNQAVARLNNLQQSEMIGKTHWEVWPWSVGTIVEQTYRLVVANQVAAHFEVFYEPLMMWLEIHAYPTIAGLSLYFRDITDHKQVELALRVSEEKFRNMADNAPCMIWVTDQTGYCTYLSQSWYEFTGQTEETGLGFGWLNATHPDDRESTEQAFVAANERHDVFRVEYRLRGSDDQYIWAINAASPWFGPEGQFKGYIGSVIDIDDRKQAESALRQSEERYRTLFESIDEGFTVIEVLFDENDKPIDYRFLEVNPAFENQTGLEQATGKTARQLVPNLEADWVETYGKIALTGESLRFENGSEAMNRWFDVYAFGIGQPYERKVAILFKDISDRKRVEKELRQKNAILEVINESAPSPIFVKDREGRIIYANPATLEVLGKSASEVIGYRDCDLYPSPDLGATVMENDRRIMASGQTEVVEESPDGIRTFLGMKAAYRNEAGVVIGLIGISYDISDRKRIEAERERILQREQAAREVAENANRIKDEFLAVLSHELRSPLNPILGWSQLLRRGKLDGVRTAQALETIERNAQLQSQLIEDLLDISRIMSGKLTLVAVPVNLSFVISAALETVRLAAEAKSIHIEVNLEPNIREVYGDAGRLQQVVWNLLSNAVKFTPPEGRVKVRLTQTNQDAQLQVIDTGKGIKSKFLPYVFEHFRQEDGATTRQFGGLGLGLAIARQIAELHGGRIWVESRGENQGAMFTVELPVLQTANLVEEVTDTTLAESDDLLLANLHVLIVDDEPDSRDFVAFVVKQAGAQVTAVDSAIEALQLLSTTSFDILLSDIGMPEMDGYALIREIRKLRGDRGGQIPAIALTAYAGEYEQREAIASGFQSHLAKPIDPAEIITVVARMCNLISIPLAL